MYTFSPPIAMARVIGSTTLSLRSHQHTGEEGTVPYHRIPQSTKWVIIVQEVNQVQQE